MKSAHRHELETNVLAQRLEEYIARLRPYAATFAGVILAVVVIMFAWSYLSGSTAARQGAAWDAYHRGIAAVPPNLEQLRRSAEEYPNTKMQQLADVTWADGQVWIASRDYINNRAAAMEALRLATSRYQGILQTTDNERLITRAHLGLARVYEMQNELGKAREEYQKITGTYQAFAKEQIERLDSPEAKDALAWLATAEAPRPRAPAGPGTPGKTPEFSAGDIPLPGEATDANAAGGTSGESFEDVLKRFDLGLPKSDEPDRYKDGQDKATTEPSAPPQSDDKKTDPVESAPPKDEKPTE